MAKGYILRAAGLELEEKEFHDGIDISNALGGVLIERTKPIFPISMEQMEAFPHIDIWCDDMGLMKGLPENLDNVNYRIVGDVVLLGHKMTPEGEDIADLPYEYAALMKQRMCANEERRETYMKREEEIDKVRKEAVMTEDSIVTGVVFDCDHKELRKAIDILNDEMGQSDEYYWERFKADVSGENYVKDGLSLDDIFLEAEEVPYVYDPAKTVSACMYCKAEDKLGADRIPGKYDFEFMIYDSYDPYDDGNEYKGAELKKSEPITISAYKIANYMQKEHGIMLNPKVAEYGRICEDGKFRIQYTEIFDRRLQMMKDVAEMKSMRQPADLSPENNGNEAKVKKGRV